jgi:hypothetical protein
MSVSYIIYESEDGVDFYKELHQTTLDKSDTDTTVAGDEEQRCMITGETLSESSIKLECGHKFNALPLYLEIYNQVNKSKTFFSINLTSAERHAIYMSKKHRFFKCPYCRNIQFTDVPGLVPSGSPGIYNNYIRIYNPSPCTAILKSGKNKGNKCGHPSHQHIYTAASDLCMNNVEMLYCKRHMKIEHQTQSTM